MSDSTDLTHDCYNTLEDVFLSCYMTDQKLNISENSDNEAFISLRQPQILQQHEWLNNVEMKFRLQVDPTPRSNAMQPSLLNVSASTCFL